MRRRPLFRQPGVLRRRQNGGLQLMPRGVAVRDTRRMIDRVQGGVLHLALGRLICRGGAGSVAARDADHERSR
jgi:hypothetical protein